jgi:hypothetical protein
MLWLVLVGGAQAYDTLGAAWDDFPVGYLVAESSCPLDSGSCVDAIDAAWSSWADPASCEGIDGLYLGLGANDTAAGDRLTNFVFEDPADLIPVGLLAGTIVTTSGVAFELDGQPYSLILDADVVFNDGIDWATEGQIGSDSCSGQYSLQGVAERQIGRVLGLAETCQVDDCTAEEEAALMAVGRLETCTPAGGPQADDLAGIGALYAGWASFRCVPETDHAEVVGAVPLAVQCVLSGSVSLDLEGAVWHLGEGTTQTGSVIEHTYVEQGNHSVWVEVPHQDGCGDDPVVARHDGYVRACDVPEVAFELFHNGGLEYHVRNASDTSVYGCMEEVSWSVYAGSGTGGKLVLGPLSAWEPELHIPQEGTFTVVGHIGGLAGTGAAKLTFDAKRSPSDDLRPFSFATSCSSIPGGSIGGIWLLIPWLLGKRRRR